MSCKINNRYTSKSPMKLLYKYIPEKIIKVFICFLQKYLLHNFKQTMRSQINNILMVFLKNGILKTWCTALVLRAVTRFLIIDNCVKTFGSIEGIVQIFLGYKQNMFDSIVNLSICSQSYVANRMMPCCLFYPNPFTS